jgi:hypothetical protein
VIRDQGVAGLHANHMFAWCEVPLHKTLAVGAAKQQRNTQLVRTEQDIEHAGLPTARGRNLHPFG